MKTLIVTVCCLLVIGHLLTEAYVIVWKINEDSATTMIKPFLKSNQEISVLWHIKMFSDELLWCITYAAFAMVAKRYSNVLYAVVMIFFMYHIVDLFMYLYNYKNTRWLYWVMLGFDVLAAVIIVFKKETLNKYKSMI